MVQCIYSDVNKTKVIDRCLSGLDAKSRERMWPQKRIQPKPHKLIQSLFYTDLATDLLSTSRYQDAFARLATACWRQVCCKLSTDLLQVDCQNLLFTGLLQVVSTSCNKSANDKLQKVWF